ncbi:MAG: hypothetical protein COY58_09785 [Gammaproteobacteria bacterium CG_4_10_14_0_8_um_filter_38_16]|nr:MAG: hypothetical protein COY58_09785 [Gammaproteobacteria bacterium CG_4_10_14_0_8_um_filter_38_16]PJA03026.1 MAG: hypothetical protein COX72_06880 [Gammaproteobacteria bacterium CG_4_10_14_0_2_um_filter_38_22]PJB10244.1 MAG: hypothetical protein CO120_06035 [Gammaproteobacteria bacterium CG_4_9_14_3_um_filter_38_9]
MKFNKLLGILISVLTGGLLCASLLPAQAAHANEHIATSQHKPNLAKNLDGLPPTALKSAINGYRWALKHHEVSNPTMLTIVDFNKPSYEKRLWVIDLNNDHVIMHMHVAQGKNSGAVYATRFSNQPGSLESSPGIFTTLDEQYDGEHGESLRVNGLEPGINSNALSRAVVIHAAWYVTPSFIKKTGYAGRSWGCFAVNPNHVDRFIHLVRGGSVLFAYASPEKDDSRVDHHLSYTGKKMYDAITNTNANPVTRFFEAL